MKPLLISILLVGCAPTAVPYANYDLPPTDTYFSYHAVPIGLENGRVLTVNYVGRSASQIGGMCYNYAKFHTFQTFNSYMMDVDTGSLDRSIRLSMAPYWQCRGDELIEEFIRDTGLVEFCLEPDYEYPFDENTCGYCDRYNSPLNGETWPVGCSVVQRSNYEVVSFKATDFVRLLTPRDRGARKNFLANSVKELGPGSITLMWAVKNIEPIEEPEFIISERVVVLTADCDRENRPLEGHVVSLIGYDFRDEPYFYIQNSIGSNQVIYKLNYNDWVDGCSFGSGYFEYYTGIETKTKDTFKDFCEE